MTKTKKILLSLGFMIAVSSITDCSSKNVPSSASVNSGADLARIRFNKLVQDLNDKGKSPFIVDMGKKNGTSFAVKINISDNENFKIKSSSVVSSSGHRFIGTDIDTVKVFIFAVSSFSSGDAITPDASMPSGSPITLTTKTGTSGGGSFDVVFTNVPGNANPWRVAVTALTTNTAAVGSFSSPRNITLGAGSTNYGTYSSENYAVSNSGGDGSGSVLIDATALTLTGTTALGVPLTLIPADGATIGSTTTVTNGSSTPTGSVSAS